MEGETGIADTAFFLFLFHKVPEMKLVVFTVIILHQRMQEIIIDIIRAHTA